MNVIRLASAVLAVGTLLIGWRSGASAQSSVRLNRVAERLADGRSVIGTFGTPSSTGRTPVGSDIDFAVIDFQYGAFDMARLHLSLLEMIDKGGILRKGNLQPDVSPLVRIPEEAHEAPEFTVRQVLAQGAYGVMFPHLESVAQVSRAVEAMRVAQHAGPLTAQGPRDEFAGAARYWGVTPAEYRRRADVWPLRPGGELLTIIQIESGPGVEHVNEMLKVPGVSAIFLGPSHLAESLGEKSSFPTHGPKTEAGIQTVLKACLAAKIACGYPVVAGSADVTKTETAKRLAQGFRMLTANTSAR